MVRIHSLLNLGLSHLNATLVLLETSLIFIIISFLLKDMSVLIVLIIIFSLALVKSYITFYLARKKIKKTSGPANV